MRALIQRVNNGAVIIDNKEICRIEKGYVVLLGVKEGDSEKKVKLLAEKTVNLRIMSDENKKMNRSILDVSGSIIVVSQFTLYADLSGGRRPSFTKAAKPEIAKQLYEMYINELGRLGVSDVKSGEFGAYMEVYIQNDGPVTIMLDSDEFK